MTIISTEDVREAYQLTGDGLDFKRRYFERGAEFDEWLESVKAEAAVGRPTSEGVKCPDLPSELPPSPR